MRAVSKMELKNFEGALLDIKKAIKMNPFHEQVMNGDAYLIMGLIYSGSGEVKNACSNFEKALKLNSLEKDKMVKSALEKIEKSYSIMQMYLSIDKAYK